MISAAITTTKGAVELAYPPYLDGYDYGFSLIGFLTALIAVVQLLSRMPVAVAYRGDRVKRQFALALVGFAISVGGFAVANGEPLAVTVLSALHGLAFGALGTLGLALAIDVSGGRRAGVSMAWYTASNSTGYAVGALVGGALADTVGIPKTFAIIALLPLAAALATLTLPPIEAAPLAFDRGSGLRGLLTAGARLDARVWLAFAIVLYLNVLMDGVDTFFPLFAAEVGISLAIVGVLRAVKSGAAIFIRSTGALLLGAVDHRRVTLVAVVAAAAATVALPLWSEPLTLVPIFVVLGLARGVLRATSAATVAELRSEGRDVGIASGVYNSGLDIGTIVGPAVGGALASVFGIGPMFQIIGVTSLALFLAVALWNPTTRRAAGLAR